MKNFVKLLNICGCFWLDYFLWYYWINCNSIFGKKFWGMWLELNLRNREGIFVDDSKLRMFLVGCDLSIDGIRYCLLEFVVG